MTLSSALTTLSTVDDYLGPADRRFFGRGFRRVDYDVRDVECSVDGGPRTRATVGVAYPADWSRKATGDLRPHFSTIDALVLAAEATELSLADAYGITSGVWLRKVRITAGNKPQEDLGSLPLGLTAPRPEIHGDHAVSTIDCRIGSMRVKVEAEHPLGDVRPGTRAYRNPASLLGPASDRYFADGFKGWSQEIRDVMVDHAGSRAEATLNVVPDGQDGVPSVSMVDGFVAALQLAQVMLYELDGVRRADSETLWMRQTTLTARRPTPLGPEGVAVSTTLENAERISMAGSLWRTADIVGDMGDVRVRCAVTHRLPEGIGQ